MRELVYLPVARELVDDYDVLRLIEESRMSPTYESTAVTWDLKDGEFAIIEESADIYTVVKIKGKLYKQIVNEESEIRYEEIK